MAGELLKMSDQFQGLPMESLIGGPLQAAANAQVMLARSTADFINIVGFAPKGKDKPGEARVAEFQYEVPRQIEIPGEPAPGQTGNAAGEKHVKVINVVDRVDLKVPLLAIVPTPNLQIDSVEITFDMEVKSSFSEAKGKDASWGVEAEGSGSYGPFSFKAKVHGKTSTHQENTRSSDNSAKYHVSVTATNHGMPEGLKRVMDMMASALAPRSVQLQTLDSDGDIVKVEAPQG